MKQLAIVTTCLMLFLGCSQSGTSDLSGGSETYRGSVYQDVWAQIESDEYEVLPQKTVSIFRFGAFFFNRLRSAANRTISDRSDLLPRFSKLVHANGICLTGTWQINQDNPYTGYFANGSQALIIARASVALSNTERGDYRAFGLAGKIFPTNDPDARTRLQTANFFTMDDLGGTMTGNFTDTVLTNAPDLSVLGRGPTATAIGAAVGSVFSAVDVEPNVRQLYEVSELGMADVNQAVTPRFMRLSGSRSSTPRAQNADFRDDMRVDNYADGLRFKIEVSTRQDSGWQTIGEITFTDDSASDSCDSRLHFHHPQAYELNHGD